MSVISDLVTDQRVHKVCMYLHEKNLDVLLVGRSFSNSHVLESRAYRSRRLSCFFRKGPLQYIEFNLRLLLFLLFEPATFLVSNDLDTLAPNYLVSRVKSIRLVYDAHEYFTGVPELMDRPIKRSIWKWLEARMLPKIKRSYTVNNSIRELYKKEYGINMEVVRNLPYRQEVEKPGPEVIPYRLILQGAGMNRDRGIEETILAMKQLPDFFSLLLVGGGSIWNELQLMTKSENLDDRIQFIPTLPFAQLRAVTQTAWLGISMDKPVSPNNTYSLPNKLFDYIHSGIPVVASSLPEVKTIIEQYAVGLCIDQVTPESIASAIQFVYHHPDKYHEWQRNTAIAAAELNWDMETQQLGKVYNGLFS